LNQKNRPYLYSPQRQTTDNRQQTTDDRRQTTDNRRQRSRNRPLWGHDRRQRFDRWSRV